MERKVALSDLQLFVSIVLSIKRERRLLSKVIFVGGLTGVYKIGTQSRCASAAGRVPPD
jgi:hypothetical protein